MVCSLLVIVKVGFSADPLSPQATKENTKTKHRIAESNILILVLIIFSSQFYFCPFLKLN